ncbi:DNA-binding barrel domain superfamily [Sesbania bispinosa]|nr:DNA-binding barrel domain superfamily [Sesbania bispinosa]
MSVKDSSTSRMKKPRSEMNVDPEDLETWYMPRWQYLEYDPRMVFYRAASQFAREFWDIVPGRVQFIDRIGNVINVVVRRDVACMYFTHGWPVLKDVYELDDGGWIKLYYQDKNVFKISIYNRDFYEAPLPIPPEEYDHSVTFLPEDVIPGYRESDLHDVHHFDETMTELQAKGNILNLPTALCERFRTKINSSVLRDDNGVVFSCQIVLVKVWKGCICHKGVEGVYYSEEFEDGYSCSFQS